MLSCIWLDEICDKIICLRSEKSRIADNINHKFAKIRICLYNSLPIEKILTFHYAIILIKSVTHNLLVNSHKNSQSIFIKTKITTTICF